MWFLPKLLEDIQKKINKQRGIRKPRKKGKCLIATDTPEKDEIEHEYLTKLEKKNKVKRKITKDRDEPKQLVEKRKKAQEEETVSL